MTHGHHHRSRDYEWKREDADRFLDSARHRAAHDYPPIADLVVEHLDGVDGRPVVLDLGSGPALLLEELARRRPEARLVAVDPSGPMLELARRVLQGSECRTCQIAEGRAEAIPAPDASVDVVVSLKNLHEWEDAGQGFSEVARVLRPGGVLVLRDSNRDFPHWRLRLLAWWRWLTRGGRAARGLLGPYRDAYRPDQVDSLVAGAGLEVVSARRTGVELLYVARRPS